MKDHGFLKVQWWQEASWSGRHGGSYREGLRAERQHDLLLTNHLQNQLGVESSSSLPSDIRKHVYTSAELGSVSRSWNWTWCFPSEVHCFPKSCKKNCKCCKSINQSNIDHIHCLIILIRCHFLCPSPSTGACVQRWCSVSCFRSLFVILRHPFTTFPGNPFQ